MKWKFACGLLTLLVVGEGALLVRGALDDVKEESIPRLPTDAVLTAVEPEVQLELARRFRPVLRFDSEERWRPLAIDRFFEAKTRNHRLCDRSALKTPCRAIDGLPAFEQTVASLAQRGRNLFVDVDGNQANGTDSRSSDPACAAPPAIVDCNRGPRTAIYYNVVGAHGRYYIDYWWFFRFNDFPEFDAAQRCEASFRPFCGDHEGDWEGVTVVTSATDPDEVEYVAFAAHSGTTRYAASQLEFDPPEARTRAVVYIAKGSHAAYPTTCLGGLPKVGCQQLATRPGVGLPEGRHDGKRPWGRNKGQACAQEPECVLPLPSAANQQSWNAYAGLWGRACAGGADCPVMKGPLSPGQQARYESPWCAHQASPDGRSFAEKSSCDVLTPGAGAVSRPGVATSEDCLAWAGASVAVLACDRDALATALAEGEEDQSETSLQLNGAEIGETTTPGVAQYVAKPIRARANVVVRGPVSDLVIQARQPLRRRPKDLLEARFTGIDLPTAAEAVARLRYRDGGLRLTLLLPSGQVLEPNAPQARPLAAPGEAEGAVGE